jgi:hypothetical protein
MTAIGLLLAGCNGGGSGKKPDPTKGRVTGIVMCADTGKPARFAFVGLYSSPTKEEKGSQSSIQDGGMTDLDGRFTIEAVEPGHYFAVATQEGYLDPERGLDFTRLAAMNDDAKAYQEAVNAWKDHLVDVTVQVHRTAEVSLVMERGAEIGGTVTFDDGSPAIGMQFQLLHKADKTNWSGVGFALFSGWRIEAKSDGHGRYSLTNLPAGEYKVCASMPYGDEDSAPVVCTGDTFRRKDASVTKVAAGEIASGVDITVPLSGMHTVAGRITALADGHAVERAIVTLVYADDREPARKVVNLDEGKFSLSYVPEGKYILQVTEAEDTDQRVSKTNPDGTQQWVDLPNTGHKYLDKEIPVIVEDDMDDLLVQLAIVPPADAPAAPQVTPPASPPTTP